MGILHVIGGLLLIYATQVTSSFAFLIIVLIYSIVYMPTVALSNNIVFANVSDTGRVFPVIRFFGTFGWIVAGFIIGKLQLENNISNLMLKIITRCVELKSNIVEQDAEDKNIRNILNFGHTIGHTLESYFNYEYINHGEAVAYGILYSSKLSNIYSDLTGSECREINDLINKIPLPVLKDLNIDKLIKLIMHDKKNINGKLKFILLKSIGEAQITTKINYNNIKTVLEEHEYISC